MSTDKFVGGLQAKKKADLQDIAFALSLDDSGTKDDLLVKINKHLDTHPQLEEQPKFAGLFASRRRRTGSVQPSGSSDNVKRSNTIRAMDPVREVTPETGDGNVSSMIKSPFAPMIHGTPSSLPPLPDSPLSVGRRSFLPDKSLLDMVPVDFGSVVANVRSGEERALKTVNENVVSIRSFMSDAQNIWSITALIELSYILYFITPWTSSTLPLSPNGDNTVDVPHPVWAALSTSTYWSVVGHWALPTLLLPAILGHLISFSPNPRGAMSGATLPFDPLTASIVRLAAAFGYPYPQINLTVAGIDVLGLKWRVLAASMSVAFAFAELIAGGPRPAAKSNSISGASSSSGARLITNDS